MNSLTALRYWALILAVFELLAVTSIITTPANFKDSQKWLGPVDSQKLAEPFMRLWCLFLLLLVVVRLAFYFDTSKSLCGLNAVVHSLEAVFFSLETFHWGRGSLTGDLEPATIVLRFCVFVLNPLWFTVTYLQMQKRGRPKQN